MREEKELQGLQEEYSNIPIPKELEYRVQEAISEGTKKRRQNKMKQHIKWVKVTAGAAAALVLVININPTFADTLSEVPVLGNLVKVINFREYKVEGERQQANIQVPQIEGLGNETLENQVNEELKQEADKVYQEFLAMSKEWEDVDSEAVYGVDMNYEVLTDTEEIFALRVNKVETIASANQEVKFYVIDKKQEKAITLPTLFKDDAYISIISEYIIQQMDQIMKQNDTKVFWIKEDDFARFTAIQADQKFYINQEGQLVIYFDKYEVGPGSTGESEFVIPTALIANLLVDNHSIR